MDVIAFKYVATVFTLILIVILVKLVNSRCFKCSVSPVKHPVMKGLSAFLMLCYSQCTDVTFRILRREVIVSNDGSPDIPVTAYGGLRYFHSQHLIYAVPALICLLTVVFLPLLYLLIIPLMLQLLCLCGLSEHAIVTALLRRLYQPRLMPLIDIFQSCFKPKLRFFAGAYFFYRIAVFAVLTFSNNEPQFYNASELVLLVILGLHAIAQPYRQKRNNIVDGMLFLNLAIINGLNIALNTTSNGLYASSLPIIITSVQLLLITAPLAIIIAGYLFAIAKKRCSRERASEYEDIGTRSMTSSLEVTQQRDDTCFEHGLLDTY
jgi:hypothetical protein